MFPKRFILFHNGLTVGIYSNSKSNDNFECENSLTSKLCSNTPKRFEAIVLESSGKSLASIQESGNVQRQLLQYTTSKIKVQVKNLTDFRNMHSPLPPVVSLRLCKQVFPSNSIPSQQYSEEGSILAHWKMDDRADCPLPTKIKSLEGNAAIKIHQHKLQAKVRFLCEVPDAQQVYIPNHWQLCDDQQKVFTWVTKCYSLREGLPSNFQPPLAMLLGCSMSTHSNMKSSYSTSLSDELQPHYVTTALPKGTDFSKPASCSAVADNGHSCQPNQVLPHEVLGLGVNEDRYLHIGSPAIAEWRPEGTYRIVDLKKGDGLRSIEVEVLVHCDNSLLVLSGQYIEHYQQPEQEPTADATTCTKKGNLPSNTCKLFHCFAVQEVKASSIGRNGHRLEYQLEPFVHTAQRLRDHYLQEQRQRHLPTRPSILDLDFSTPQQLSDPQVGTEYGEMMREIETCLKFNTQIHRQTVTGEGTFTAFRDYRVRANFVDRTLLELGPCHQRGKVITKEGEQALVNVTQPHPFERYIQQTLDFARWAFLTDEEKLRLKSNQEQAESILRAEQDKIRRFRCLSSKSATSFSTPSPILIGNGSKRRSGQECHPYKPQSMNMALPDDLSSLFCHTQIRNSSISCNQMNVKQNKGVFEKYSNSTTSADLINSILKINQEHIERVNKHINAAAKNNIT